MSKLVRSDAGFGTSCHIGDCYVWAEIFYLDSPTDYREYLPERRAIAAVFGQFTTLDNPAGFLKHTTRSLLRSMRAALQTFGVD